MADGEAVGIEAAERRESDLVIVGAIGGGMKRTATDNAMATAIGSGSGGVAESEGLRDGVASNLAKSTANGP